MKRKHSGVVEYDGIIAGNVFDKYGSRNPLIKWLMKRFDATLSELIGRANPATIHDVGCGEGFWVVRWNERGLAARGTDGSCDIVETARLLATAKGLSPLLFQVRSIYELRADCDKADLVTCLEVLEHLERPEEALKALRGVVDSHLLVSVPWEPVWRLLNLARGKYIRSLGNTPGHIQHWNRRGIGDLVSRYFHVVDVRLSFPWLVLLCRPLR